MKSIITINLSKENLLYNIKSYLPEEHIYIVDGFEGMKAIVFDLVNDCYSSMDWTINYQLLLNEHIDIANQLFPEDDDIFIDLNELFVELEWELEEEPSNDRSYFEDQLLNVLPVIAAKIFYRYAQLNWRSVCYLDTRDLLTTDNNYGDGRINMELSSKNYKKIQSLFSSKESLVLPADIGSSTENYGVVLKDGSLKAFIEKMN